MNKNIDQLLEQSREKLGDTEERKRELQEEMASPKDLNDIENELQDDKKEMIMLEDLSDFAKDNNTYHRGFERNSALFKQELLKQESSPSAYNTLVTLAKFERELREELEDQDNEDQAFQDQASQDQASQGQAPQDQSYRDIGPENRSPNREPGHPQDTDDIPGSFLDDID